MHTPASGFPHGERLQQLFGRHDIRQVRAHLGAEAADSARAICAAAYTRGDDVVFARLPDLPTAAHEAVHVLQQRSGVRPVGGVGQEGDQWERDAAAVAARVAAGRSAQDLLDHLTGTHACPAALQRKLDVTGIKYLGSVMKAVAQLGSDELKAGIQAAESDKFDLRVHVEEADAQAADHGTTAIYSDVLLGKSDDAPLLVEQLARTMPEKLLSQNSKLTIDVTVYSVKSETAGHQAATLIHELELHAVPAFDLVNTILALREKGDSESVIKAVFGDARQSDEHRNVDRLLSYLQTAHKVASAATKLKDDLLRSATLDIVDQFTSHERRYLESITDPQSRDAAQGQSIKSLSRILAAIKTSGITFDTARVANLLLPSPLGPSPAAQQPATGPARKAQQPGTGSVSRDEAKRIVTDKVIKQREGIADIVEDMAALGVSRADAIYFYNEYAMAKLAELATDAGAKTRDEFFDFAKKYGVEAISVIYYYNNHRFPRPRDPVKPKAEPRRRKDEPEAKRTRREKD